jgi:hypothetical protein
MLEQIPTRSYFVKSLDQLHLSSFL